MQNAEREEITKRVLQEEQKIREAQAKIKAKQKEIENAKEARGKRISKLTAQWEQEKTSRKKIENQLKDVSEKLSGLDVRPELEVCHVCVRFGRILSSGEAARTAEESR